ncbi:MAG: hypothetical protein EDM05_000430 (plasmid) [Leptolyngbya sp. IPPAS B-1204]
MQGGYAQAMICGGTEAAVTPLSSLDLPPVRLSRLAMTIRPAPAVPLYVAMDL